MMKTVQFFVNVLILDNIEPVALSTNLLVVVVADD